MSDTYRRFCVCGYSVKVDADHPDFTPLRRHRESGEHGAMMKVNALRDGMAAVDAAVDREIVEGSDHE